MHFSFKKCCAHYYSHNVYLSGQNESSNTVWTKVRNSYLGQQLLCYTIPQSGIKEIYLGANVYRNAVRIEEGQNEHTVTDNIEFIKSLGCKVFRCEPDVSTWDLLSVEL